MARIHTLDSELQQKWINALIRSRFISPNGEAFLIHGNKIQIEQRVSKTHTSSKGGEATKRKWEKIKAERGLAASRQPTPSLPPASVQLAESRPEPSLDQAETTQSLGTIQCNAIQGNTLPPNPHGGGDTGSGSDALELEEIITQWGITMRHFAITLDPRTDDHALRKLLNRHGFALTRAAIIGARYEQGTNTFNPAKHLSISRISKPGTFEKFVKLGSQDPTQAPQSPASPDNWVPKEMRASV